MLLNILWWEGDELHILTDLFIIWSKTHLIIFCCFCQCHIGWDSPPDPIEVLLVINIDNLVLFDQPSIKFWLQIKTKYGPNLDTIGVGRLVGVLVDQLSQLHLYVDGADQGVAATNIPTTCRVVIDVYGRCEQVRLYVYAKRTSLSKKYIKILHVQILNFLTKNCLQIATNGVSNLLSLCISYIGTIFKFYNNFKCVVWNWSTYGPKSRRAPVDISQPVEHGMKKLSDYDLCWMSRSWGPKSYITECFV